MLERLLSLLTPVFSGTPVWIWIAALAAAALICAALKLSRQLLIQHLFRPAREKLPAGAAAAARLVEGTGIFFLGAFSFWLAALLFALLADLRRLIGELALLALFWQLGWWSSVMISFSWE